MNAFLASSASSIFLGIGRKRGEHSAWWLLPASSVDRLLTVHFLSLLPNTTVGTVLEKGVSRSGMVGMGNYKYYKLHLNCVEAAQALTFTLTALNGNPDVYISNTLRNPSPAGYTYKSESLTSEDVIEIPAPPAGTYYIGVYGKTTATFKLRALTKMFTGKHPCHGFRLVDSDLDELNTDGSFLLENTMTVTGGANFESNLNVLQDVTLGDAETDSVAIKGQITLGTAGPGEYVVNKQDALNNTAGSLVIRGANAIGGLAGNVTLAAGLGTDGRGGSMNLFAGGASNADAGDLTIGTGRSVEGRAGNLTIFVDRGDVGVGGNISVSAGLTTAQDMPGGSLNIAAGVGENAAGGRGGVVKVSGGFAGGTQDCDLQEYECAGLNISVAMYEAVLHGCTSDCTFFGNDAPNVTTYLCGTTEVTEEEYLAVMGGCTQKCLGGAVEITGGLASGGVGGAVVLTGGDTNSTDPYGRGGNVEIRGGKASSGSGGSVIMSSGRSEALSSGDVVVQTTSSGAGGVSGAVAAETGAACAGDSGAITVATGSATTGSGGDVNLLVGSGDTENGGAVVMRAGETAADSKQGGGVFITSGAGSSAQGGVGGELVMMAGSAEGDSEGDGGRVEIRGGKAVGGKGGDVAVAAGNSYTGDGGALVLQGGYSEFGNGGDVIMDAGDSGTGDSTKEGLIRIAPTSASFVRIGRSGSKTVRTDVFGDLTVHGSFVSTSSMVYQDTYTERVHISTEQDQMIQEEMRVPKITGLDSEDVAGDPTSTLTLDAGQGGTQQWLEIGPWEATRITIGGRNVGGDDALSHVGYRNATPILIRQGYDEADKRLQVNESGAIVMQSSATMPILIHSNPTRGTNGTGGDIDLLVGSGDTGHGGNMTLTAGDTTDDNHRGGFLTLTAGGNNNTAGGRGGVVKVSGGFAGGTQDCDLQEYECAGLNISVAMYEAVLHGCTSDCTFFGNDAPNVTTYLCGTTEVTEEEYLAVMGGCTQKCLGGAVEITGGLASGGVGGAVVLTGGDTNSTDPYGRGGNVEIRGGKASLGSGGSVIMSSGRSEALSSGDVVVQTTSSGAGGVSGAVAAETGAACAGDSGAITVATGSATTGSGGDVNLLVGSGDTENGGAVVMRRGRPRPTRSRVAACSSHPEPEAARREASAASW